MQQISDGVLLSASGCLSDTLELKQVLKRNSKLYEWENGKIIFVNAMSHLLAYVLYSRRTFPCKFYVVILMFIVIVIDVYCDCYCYCYCYFVCYVEYPCSNID